MTQHTPHALHTDLYQLTMLLGYLHRGLAQTPAVFELFVRRLPPGRSVLLTAGLSAAVDYLHRLRLDRQQLEQLARIPALGPLLTDDVCRELLALRFTGDLWAMPEGTVALAGEPLLRVEAPLGQAQLVETTLLSLVNHATLVASKAARIVAAADGRAVMEFGSRRTQVHAAVEAARAAYIAGCVGSSNVEAGVRYGVPVYGTMAHSWVMAHDSEEQAFDSYLASYPRQATLLVDTYDTLCGIGRACAAARRAGGTEALGAVRIDSRLFDGDGRPSGICARARQLLDRLGFAETRIVVSDDLNEGRIAALLAADEPIDAFGVGTELVTSKDAPALGGVYKLVWIGGSQGRAALKLSPGKVTYPGAHQVWRLHDAAGALQGDQLRLARQLAPVAPAGCSWSPLLQPVLRGGELVAPLDDLQTMRRRAQRQLAALAPGAILGDGPAAQLAISAEVQALAARAQAQLQDTAQPTDTA